MKMHLIYSSICRGEYDKLRRRCQQIIEFNNNLKVNEVGVANKSGKDENNNNNVTGSADTEEDSGRESPRKEVNPSAEYSDDPLKRLAEK